VSPHTRRRAWTLQQLREAIGFDDGYRYLIHDRDSIFARDVDGVIKGFGLRVLKSPPRSPMANAVCERLIGTIRRECLDWLIPISEGNRHRGTGLRFISPTTSQLVEATIPRGCSRGGRGCTGEGISPQSIRYVCRTCATRCHRHVPKGFTDQLPSVVHRKGFVVEARARGLSRSMNGRAASAAADRSLRTPNTGHP
jgi:transposase InsO family protein